MSVTKSYSNPHVTTMSTPERAINDQRFAANLTARIDQQVWRVIVKTKGNLGSRPYPPAREVSTTRVRHASCVDVEDTSPTNVTNMQPSNPAR